jgi:hypothetical protein
MKLKYILFSAIIMLASCSQDFLDLYPQTSLNEQNFYQSDDEFVLLVNGCYIPMRNLGRRVYWDNSEVKSDNVDLQALNTDIEQGRNDGFGYNASSTYHKSHWDNSYTGIYYCNKAIAAIETHEHTWKDTALKERSLGEAYFLRAWYYFDLVRQFGGVPLVTKGITGNEAIGVKRSSEKETYDLIISDLETAISHLTQMGTTGEYGRGNLGAAQALLAKVYLTLHDYAKAENLLYTVIRSGNFGLLENYADVFDPNHKDYYETLFSIQYSESSSALSNAFIFYFAPVTSKGEVTGRPNVNLAQASATKPTSVIINAFEPGDERFGVSIGKWRGPNTVGDTTDFYYCAKYKGPQTASLGWCGDNFPILRYSDVLLMYAEALNEQGRTADAISYVEQVRRRAKLMNDFSGINKDQLTLLIEHERQVEFCFENQRWFDLIRTSRAIPVMTALGKNLQPHLLIAPIPGDQVVINQLEQNPGY